MSDKPGHWDELTADERRTLRLEAWVRGDGIQFDGPEARAKYVERATLLRDAWELKKTPPGPRSTMVKRRPSGPWSISPKSTASIKGDDAGITA